LIRRVLLIYPGFKKEKELVNSLCLGKNGELDVGDGQRRGDKYGREIWMVYFNGVNINEKRLSMDRGLPIWKIHHYLFYPNESPKKSFWSG
jgi:hypothetical protein